MSDGAQQADAVNRFGRWLRYSPQPVWYLLVAFTFGVYAVLGFEVTVVMLLLLIAREEARP